MRLPFRTTPASARETRAFLSGSLVDDDATFVTLLDTLEPERLREAFAGQAGRRFAADLAQQVIAFDRPHAMRALDGRTQRMVSAPDLEPIYRGYPWRNGTADALAVRHHSRQIALNLLRKDLMLYDDFVAEFGHDVAEELSAMVAVGEMRAQDFLQLYPERRAEALQWLAGGLLQPEEFCRRFLDEPHEVDGWVRAALIPANLAVRHFPYKEDDSAVAAPIIAGWVKDALLGADEALASLSQALLRKDLLMDIAPHASNDAVEQACALLNGHPTAHSEPKQRPHALTSEDLLQLLEMGKLTLQQCIAHGGKPSKEVLLQGVETGEITAAQAMSAGILTLQSMEALLPTRLAMPDVAGVAPSSSQSLRVALAQAYVSERPLCRDEIEFACSWYSLEQLFNCLSYPESEHRLSYAVRMAAACLQTSAAYTPAPAMPTDTGPCDVCFESDCGAPFKPAACAHAATMGRGCVQQAVRLHVTDICPYPNCNTPLTPNDCIELGLGAAHADALARRIVHAHQASLRGWRECGTEGCVGGRVERYAAEATLHCNVCLRDTPLAAYGNVDLQRDRPKIKRLISDLTTLPFRSLQGLIRECYHCGAACEHMGGCSHMACSRCHGGFDFITGSAYTTPLLSQSQQYVPKDGLLLRAGLYRGLTPGKVYTSTRLAATVRYNALRLGI